MSASDDGKSSQNKRKGGRIVKSRYLQYDKKNSSKDGATKSRLSSTSSVSSTAKASSMLSQKYEDSGVASGLFNQSSFEKGDLQSTLLEGDKVTRPNLDLSAINDKTVCQKTESLDASCKADKEAVVKKKESKYDPVAVAAELESQELILTYLKVKQINQVAQLEEKAEENLLMLCEEKERQQQKLYELKREILLKEREAKLDEELVRQMEVLSPLVPLLEQFKEQYKSFALALDATRHKLPIKNIHIEGDIPTYLEKLQKQLTVTQELLAEIIPDSSEESAKAFNELQGIEEAFQKLEKELQRSFTQVQDLSYEASKEVSLHNQRICEDRHGVDVVKHWYFN